MDIARKDVILVAELTTEPMQEGTEESETTDSAEEAVEIPSAETANTTTQEQ